MSKQATISNKPTVLAVGLFVPGTGFTRVFETLFTILSAQYDIHWMGIGYREKSFVTPHYTLHPVNREGGDIFGAFGTAAMAEELGAKTIWLLNDFYLLRNYGYVWEPLKKKGIRLVAYVPLDGYFNQAELVADCCFLDDLVLYSNWALEEVKSNMELYGREHNVPHWPHLHCIYHGVDIHGFRKANAVLAAQLRQKIFAVPAAADAFFILNANRYNERKDIDCSLQAFSLALPSFQQPTYLCLHMPATDPVKKKELDETIARYGLQDHIICNPLGDEYVSNEQLCELYQACQVGINTSLGEGWGLISFEHAACGGAQIVPGHSTPGELWKNAGLLIPAKEPIQLETSPFRMYKLDEERLADQLITLVNDRIYREQVRKKCYALACDKKFDWEEIATSWQSLIG